MNNLLVDYPVQKISFEQKIKFDCGDDDLNEFFTKDAIQYQNELLAATYCCRKDQKIIAMFSLSNDALKLSNRLKEEKFKENLFLRSYPAVKIGRLGVAESHKNKKIGSQILNFLKLFFIIKNKTGCRFLTVDAYNDSKIIQFYKKNDFTVFTEKDKNKNTRTMYVDLINFYKTIHQDKKLLEIYENVITELS